MIHLRVTNTPFNLVWSHNFVYYHHESPQYLISYMIRIFLPDSCTTFNRGFEGLALFLFKDKLNKIVYNVIGENVCIFLRLFGNTSSIAFRFLCNWNFDIWLYKSLPPSMHLSPLNFNFYVMKNMFIRTTFYAKEEPSTDLESPILPGFYVCVLSLKLYTLI